MAPAPPALTDRRVEMTGPTDAKMAVNALNSGAKVWLAHVIGLGSACGVHILEKSAA